MITSSGDLTNSASLAYSQVVVMYNIHVFTIVHNMVLGTDRREFQSIATDTKTFEV